MARGDRAAADLAYDAGVRACLWIVIAVAGCAEPRTPPTPPQPKPPPKPTCVDSSATLAGIDVSTYQGDIDWPAVKAAGIEFAFVRASHGTDEDVRFATNWAGARDAGIVRGAYQYFHPAQDALAQAELVLTTVGALASRDLPLVLDVEAADDLPPAEVIAAVRIWIERVVAATGRQPIIYTGFY